MTAAHADMSSACHTPPGQTFGTRDTSPSALHFMIIRDPKEAKAASSRRTVRSHVARRQWQEDAPRRESQRESQRASRPRRRSSRTQDLVLEVRQVATVSNSLPYMSLPPLSGLLGGGRVDPFRTYPAPWRPFFPAIVDHYLVNMAVDIPELDQPGNRGLLRTKWFPLVMTEPATFLVIILIAASHYASVQNSGTSLAMNLLQMKYRAISAINAALQNSAPENQVPCPNDSIVGAVAKMASYEAMFGSMHTYNVHMNGLRRIIDIRGGLDALGLDGLLRRMVLWIDRNSAFLHDCSLHFPGATFAPGQSVPAPSPAHFLGA